MTSARYDPSHRATHPYPQMSIEQICALDVAGLAHPDSILWLWTTNHHIEQALAVVRAWGFQQRTILTWAKDRMGMGDWLRGQTEHCIMAVRGQPIVTLTDANHAVARRDACQFGKAGIVLRAGRVALPGAALSRDVRAQAAAGLGWLGQ